MTVAVIESEVLEPGEKTLEELAAEINREFSATRASVAQALQHAINCGVFLIEARKRVGYHGWSKWLSQNTEISIARASNFMRIGAYHDRFPPEVFLPYKDKLGHTQFPSQSRALAYVKGLPPLFNEGKGGSRYTPEMKKEIRKLVADGLSYDQVAKMMGVSAGGVRYTCDPDFAKKAREKTRESRRKVVAATKALQQQNRLAEMKRNAEASGGALEETYSLIRRALQKADEAQLQKQSPEYRSAMRETLRMLHRAEDEIAKALRVPS